MAAIDDLKSAVSDLTAELDRNNRDIEALLGRITASGASEADIAAAAAAIKELTSANKALVDKADAALAPAPAPAPVAEPPADPAPSA